MGWLKKVVKSKFGKVMDTFSAAFSNPVSSVQAVFTKSTFKELTKEHFEKPLGVQISKTVVSAAMYGAAVYGVGVIAAKGIGTAAASLIPTTIKGKVIGFVAAPFGAAYLIKDPKVIEKVSELPATMFKAGTLAADPDIGEIGEFIKEHPIATAAAAAALAGTVGYGVVAAARILTSGKEKIQLVKEKVVGGSESIVPITPQTTTISTGERAQELLPVKKTPSMKQSVKINIINKPRTAGIRISNKRYINHCLLN